MDFYGYPEQAFPVWLSRVVQTFLLSGEPDVESFHRDCDLACGATLDRAPVHDDVVSPILSRLLLVLLVHNVMILMDDLFPEGSRAAVFFEPVKGSQNMSSILVKPHEGHRNKCVEEPTRETSGPCPILSLFPQVAAGFQKFPVSFSEAKRAQHGFIMKSKC